MRQSHVLLYLPVLILAANTSIPSLAGQSASNLTATEIIKRSVGVNYSDWRAQTEYSYRERDGKTKAGSGPSKTYEIMMIEGSPYHRLVALNDQPLTQIQEQQEQAKLQTEMQRRQNESPSERRSRIAKYQNGRAEEHLLMQQMVDAFNFTLVGEERIEGADCYILDATPNPDYRPPVEKARVLTGMKGRLWIEKDHFHWAKVEAQVISPVEFGFFVAKVKPGTRFELDQAPVGDVWLPKGFTETVNASVFGLYAMHDADEESYSDYHQNMLSAGNRTVAH